jgi:hypothetical protein
LVLIEIRPLSGNSSVDYGPGQTGCHLSRHPCGHLVRSGGGDLSLRSRQLGVSNVGGASRVQRLLEPKGPANRGGSAVIKRYALRLNLCLSGYTPFQLIKSSTIARIREGNSHDAQRALPNDSQNITTFSVAISYYPT